MDIRIVAFNISDRFEKRETLAQIDILIEGELTLRRCALMRTEDGYAVFPPRARRSGEAPPAAWSRKGSFAGEINRAAIAAYEALTGKALD